MAMPHGNNKTSSAQSFTTVEETISHPAFPGTLWGLEPTTKGKFPAAKDRNGPVHIAWEVHGSGPVKIVLVMGLAIVKTSWQRQTCYFGHDRGDEYSVLIFDNRGIGESDKPLTRYSTSEMARDAIEVIDHIGWTSEREINLLGISLGGMIAQEIACLIPSRLQSLSLISTTATIRNSKSARAMVAERIGLLVPRSEERTIQDTAKAVFPLEYLSLPDTAALPSPKTTPNLTPAPGGTGGDGEYLHFQTNFQRFQAQDLYKRRTPGYFNKQGFLCQLIAAGWHRKSAEQLRDMADKVGRERIMVMHGTADNMITVGNGRSLVEMLEPGSEHIVEGMGHAPIMERSVWFNELLEERLKAWTKLDEKI